MFISRLFIISLIAFMTIGTQNYLFGASAAELTAKLKSLSFKAILRQDGEDLIELLAYTRCLIEFLQWSTSIKMRIV